MVARAQTNILVINLLPVRVRKMFMHIFEGEKSVIVKI